MIASKNIEIRIKKLEALRAKLLAIEEERKRNKLLSLPSQLGYRDLSDLILALKEINRGSRVLRRKKKGITNFSERPRKKRVSVTGEMHSEVKKLLQRGKTAREVADNLGISIPTVYSIKKTAGLVKARK